MSDVAAALGRPPSWLEAPGGTRSSFLERTEQTQTLDHTGLGSQRAGNRYVVHPDDIRRLQGEAFIIHSGQALKLRVRPPRSRPSAAEAALDRIAEDRSALRSRSPA